MKTKAYVDLFERLEILSHREIEARHDVELENYTLKLQIEARILGDLCNAYIIPPVVEYQNKLIQNIKGLKDAFGKEGNTLGQAQMEIVKTISNHLNYTYLYVNEMIEVRKKANKLEHAEEKAFAYCNEVKPYFDKIRYHVDKLELITDDKLWPLPKMRELLFTR